MALAKSLTLTCNGELALLLALQLFMALTMQLALQWIHLNYPIYPVIVYGIS